MDSASIRLIYEKLSTDSVQLQNGKEFLENLLTSNPNFLRDSLLLCLDPSLGIAMRQFIGVLVKNLLKDNWETHASLNHAQKQGIRETILKGAVVSLNEHKLIEILALITSELIIRDGIQIWLQSLYDLIRVLFADLSNPHISASLEFFSILFSKVDNRIHVLSSGLIPILVSLANPLNPKILEESLVLFYLCLASFSFADGTNNALVKECLEPTFEKWLQIFLDLLRTPIDTHLASKRYVFKILTIFFRDFPYYSKPFLKRMIGDIWSFFNKMPDLFCRNVLESANVSKGMEKNKLDDEYFDGMEEDWENEAEGLIIQIIELFLTILNKHEIQSLILNGLYPLTNTLIHLLMITRTQEKKWINEPNQFISEDEDEANLRSLRNVGLKLISHIIENFSEQYMPHLLNLIDITLKPKSFQLQMKALDSIFSSIQSTKLFQESSKYIDIKSLFLTSAFNSEAYQWRKKEVGFLLLGSFSEDILDYQNSSSSGFEIVGLIRSIMREITEDQNIEKIVEARGVWCLTRFASYLDEAQHELMEELIGLAYNSLRGAKFVALKLISAKASALFLFKAWKNGILGDIAKKIDLRDIINEFIALFAIASEETLHIVLEGIQYLLKISPECRKSVASQAITYLFKSFQLFHNEVLIGSLLQEIMETLVEEGETFKIVFDAFWPLIFQIFKSFEGHINNEKEKLRSMIKPTDISLITNLIDVLKLFMKSKVFSAFPEKNKVFELLPALTTIVLFNEDVALSVHANICLKYFVIGFKSELKANFANDLLNLLLKLTQNTNENGLLYLGNLFLIINHEIFDDKLRDSTLLSNILYSLFQHTKTPSVVQNLLLIFSTMLNSNFNESFEFLINLMINPQKKINGIHVFLEKVISYQSVLKGKLVKNSLYFSLTKLFMSRDPRLEQIFIHENKAPAKILSTLVRALDEETSNKIKVRSIDFEEMLYGSNQNEDNEEEMGDFNGGFMSGEGYEGEEFEETLGQIDEENEGKLLAEDLEYLGDVSTKFELQEVLKEFFKEFMGDKNNFSLISKDERMVLERCLKH